MGGDNGQTLGSSLTPSRFLILDTVIKIGVWLLEIN